MNGMEEVHTRLPNKLIVIRWTNPFVHNLDTFSTKNNNTLNMRFGYFLVLKIIFLNIKNYTFEIFIFV